MAIAFRHLVRMPNGDTEIEGTGLRVYTVLGLRQAGDTPEEIADAYRLPLGAVYEALAYAADNPDEMDAIGQAEAKIERAWLMGLPEELRRGTDIP
ncbi:MAG TPA: DUF433 domain-containing protein [Chloroflexota bacterium]|nr:DUF433 domain-containing protein [Chloroflexota bacterium]